MKISCKVIEDLLPIYHDGVCSEESRAMVEEHLSECECCRNMLAEMDAELALTKPAADEMRPLAKITAKWTRMRRKSLLVGTAVTLLFVGMLVGVYQFAARARIFPVNVEKIQVSEVGQLENGVITFHLYITDDAPLYRMSLQREGDVMYLVPKRALLDYWPSYLNMRYKMMNDRYFPVAVRELLSEEAIAAADIQIWDNLEAIRVGTPEEYVSVWERGMELAPAEKVLEEWYADGWR